MKKIKSIIIVLVIILIIIIGILVYINREEHHEIQHGEEYRPVETITNETLTDNYYAVIAVVTKFVNTAEQEDKEKLLTMIDDKVLKECNITEKNILEKIDIPPIENDRVNYKVKVKDMYYIDKDTTSLHFVYGYIVNNSTLEKINLKLIVELDELNKTFNIYPTEYIEKKGYDKLTIGDRLDIETQAISNRNNYNIFSYRIVTDDEIAYNYFEDYKDYLLIDQDYMYELLEPDYANKKFKDKDDFYKYIENNKVDIFTAKLDKYSDKWLENGNKQYICIAENQDVYIFNEKGGVMEYKVMLDNYTIDSEVFKQTYDSTNDQGKVALNIDKFIKAINDKSYYYAYNLLSEGFKSNYFNTQEEFENYAKNTFFDNNNINYENGKISVDSGLYKYKLTITNSEGESITKTFIMKLNDNREFEMSFNIN